MKHESNAYAHLLKLLGETKYILDKGCFTPLGRGTLEGIMEDMLVRCEASKYHVETFRNWFDEYKRSAR